MSLIAILPFAHQLLASSLKTGDIAIDGTMGNGNDTLFLAQCVGDLGHVYAFDIQAAALQATAQRLAQHNLQHRATLLSVGHQHLADYVPHNVAAAVFNFGYLPRGDQRITTLPETSVAAIQAALRVLREGGLLVLVVYHGHDMGKTEMAVIVSFVEKLPQNQYRVLRYEFINQQNCPPFVLAIEKLTQRNQ